MSSGTGPGIETARHLARMASDGTARSECNVETHACALILYVAGELAEVTGVHADVFRQHELDAEVGGQRVVCHRDAGDGEATA